MKKPVSDVIAAAQDRAAATCDAAVPMKTAKREGEIDSERKPNGEMSSADNNRANRASSAPSRAGTRTAIPAQQQQNDARKDSSVRVAVRVRPLLPKEIATNERVCVERKDNTITVSSTEKRFTFDHVFPTSASQNDMYEEALQPLMESFLQGFNVTVIAYGQTGSGKTFTMGNSIAASSAISSRLFLQPNLAVSKANEEEPARGLVDRVQDGEGLIPRFLHQLFTRLKETESVGGNQVSVSFLEIYGEEIHDLLQESGRLNQDENSQSLQLRESEKEVWVQGLTEVKIESRREALEQMRVGSLRRATGSTEMNEHSSRSHAVYTVKIVRRVNRRESLGGNSATSLKAANGSSMANGKQKSVNGRRLSFDANSSADGDDTSDGGAADATIVSKLTFVDLAGSERLKRTQAEGNRMKEGIQINVGLLALGNVINALGDKKNHGSAPVQVHVPYRSSKLTRLLQDALGGNSRTLFIACVSPAEVNSNETLNTLQYANRAKNIQNKAVKNIDSRSAELLGLKAFNKLLCRELIKAHFVKSDGVDPAHTEAMVDALLRDPTVQAYLKRLEQIAASSGIDAGGNEADEDNQAELRRLNTQLSRILSDRLGDGAICTQQQEPAGKSAGAEKLDMENELERNSEQLVKVHEKPGAATSEVVDILSSPTDECRSTKCSEQLAILANRCAAADANVFELQAMHAKLEAQLATRNKDSEDLRTKVLELEANVQTSKVKEEAFLVLDRCQEIWGELGLDTEDQAGKIKDINTLLLKKWSEELEGLQSAREKLQARIDAVYEHVKILEDLLSVQEPIDLKQLHSIAGKALLAQEKHLLAVQKILEVELCQRFQTRVHVLQKIRDLLGMMGLTSLEEFRHVSIEEHKPVFSRLLLTVGQLDTWNDSEQITVLRVLASSQDLDLSTSSLAQDELFVSALLEEKAKRFVEAEEQLQGIRSVLNQLKLTPEDVLCVLSRSVSTEEDDKLSGIIECIFQSVGDIDVSSSGLVFLSGLRRSLAEIYDGRTNAISYLYSTLEEAMVLAKDILGDASAEDTQLLIGGQKHASAEKITFGCDHHELIKGKQRLEELGGPVESSLRALLLSMDDDFLAFGIETDTQRISFFLGSDDDENNATRKILEQYVLGSSRLDSSASGDQAHRPNSFLSDLDPDFDEFGEIYSAEFGKLKLERMRDSIRDVNVVQHTVQSAQKRLNSLNKIMKLFNEISEFKKKLGQFEANASQKDRLFGNSLRLLEEEKFRKMAAKRYPNLLAALRKEVEKWLQNEEGEFDLSILGNDLKNLLLDMMNTDTGLMHLDLGVVDPFRTSTRRQPKAALTPTPGNTQSATTASSNLNASAPARSRSMTVLTSDSSAKKRLAFEH